ncbi:MAG: glycosyltransferase family 2 protein [Alphaproteobacteria bacterium]|nr:glycosyltransferase family 2 protein [Alphaproteobacteria bacterium]
MTGINKVLTSASPPFFSVLVINYNAGAWLAQCLDALLRQDWREFEVLVADNGSTDGSLGQVPNDPRIRVLKLGSNLGFAVANNVAAKEARGDWLATLNPDAFPNRYWLRSLAEGITAHPGVAMFGSTQLLASDDSLIDGTGDQYHILGIPWRANEGRSVRHLPPGDVEVFAPCAAAACYHKEAFLNAGGFDEAFFCYCEDVDLAFRLRLKGHQAVQLRHAMVRHVGSGISGRKSEFSVYHGFRNRLWVFVKNMPGPLFWPLLVFHLEAQLVLLIRALRQGVLWPAMKGLGAGLLGLPHVWGQRRALQQIRTARLVTLLHAFRWSLRAMLKRTL